MSFVAVTGFGKAVRVHCDDNVHVIENVLSFHYGPVWALAIGNRPGYGTLAATGGDDKWLTLWSPESRRLVTRARTKFPIRCCHFDCTGSFIAVGMVGGTFSVYQVEIGSAKGTGFNRPQFLSQLLLSEILSRKEFSEDISDIKFSPNGKMLAVGSHDSYIDIYACGFSLATHLVSGTTDIRRLKRLAGHTSFITHLDWSADNSLLQSTCGSYEILYWDISKGKQLLSSIDAIESDTAWGSYTCPIGFSVMGIWPANADGTDVNSVEVIYNKGIVLTGDDFGHLNLFNYPCVVKNAPCITGIGHSSHVMNVRTVASLVGQETLTLTVGGNDNTVMVWTIKRN